MVSDHAIDIIIKAIDKATEIGNKVQENFNKIGDKASQAFDKANQSNDKFSNSMKNTSQIGQSAYAQLSTSQLQYIKQISTSESYNKKLGDSIKNVGNVGNSVFENIKTAGSNAFNNIKSAASSAFDNIKSVGSNAFNNIKSGLSSAASSASEFISSLDGVESALMGVLGAVGIQNIGDLIFGNAMKSEKNQVLLSQMSGTAEGAKQLFNTVDKATDQGSVSMQQVIPAMNAFQKATQSTGADMNRYAPTISKFGSYVMNLKGSAAEAEGAMFDLSKGITGAFASLDQFGITEQTLKATGLWSGRKDDVEGYMAAVEALIPSQEELMNTTEGVLTQIGKKFSVAGKAIGKDILPVIKSIAQGFIELNNALGGNLAKAILLIGGALSGLLVVAGTLGAVWPALTGGFALMGGAVSTLTGVLGTNSVATTTAIGAAAAHTSGMGMNTAAVTSNAAAHNANLLTRIRSIPTWIGETAAKIANTVATTANSIAVLAGGTAAVTATGANVGLTASLWAMAAALLANPITWVVIAVIALAAALIYLWNTNEGFRNALINTWEAIKGAVMPVIDWLSGAVGNLASTFQGIAGAIQNAISNAWSAVTGFFGNLWSKITDLFLSSFYDEQGKWLGVIPGILNLLWKIGEAILNGILALPGLIMSGLSALWGALTSLPGLIIEGLTNLFTSAGTGAGYVVQSLIDGLISAIQTIPQAILNAVSTIGHGSIELVGMIIDFLFGEGAGDQITAKLHEILNSIMAALSSITGFITGGLSTILASGSNLIGTLVDWIFGDGDFSQVSAAAALLINNIGTFLTNLPHQIINLVQNIFSTGIDIVSLIVGMIFGKEAGDAFKSKATNLLNSITAALHSLVDGVVNTVTSIFSVAMDIGSIIVGAIFGEGSTTGLQTAIMNFLTYLSTLPTQLLTYLMLGLTVILNWGMQIALQAILIGAQFVQSIIIFISQLPTRIWTFLLTTIARVVSFGTNLSSKFRSIFSSAVNIAKSFISQLPGIVWQEMMNIVAKIGQAAGAIFNKVKEVFGNVVKWAMEALGMSSPGTISKMMGKEMGWTLEHIKNMARPARAAAEALGKKIISGFGSPSLEVDMETGETQWNSIKGSLGFDNVFPWDKSSKKNDKDSNNRLIEIKEINATLHVNDNLENKSRIMEIFNQFKGIIKDEVLTEIAEGLERINDAKAN